MKLTYAVILATSLAFWACSDDSSSTSASDEKTPSSDSSSAKYDCTTEDGVVVVYPKGGEKFKVGETIKVVYGASPDLSGSQFRFAYRANEDADVNDLTESSAGEKNPDGKTCYEQEVKLDASLVEPSKEAFIQVIPYAKTRKNGKSGKFTVTE